MINKNFKNFKIGIFGGSFDPIHNGHINSILTVKKKIKLDKIYVVPTNKNPLKNDIYGAAPNQRLEMVSLAIKEYEDFIKLDDQEIQRGGTSYTVDTIRNYIKKYDSKNIYLILGIDKFYEFNEWKDFHLIIEMANLIITSRPGFSFPANPLECPEIIRERIKKFLKNKIILSTASFIRFLSLDDINISAKMLRKYINLDKENKLTGLLNRDVENYIKKKKLYQKSNKKFIDFKECTFFCANNLQAKGGINIRAFDLTSLNSPYDYTLIVSGRSSIHAKSLANFLVSEIKKNFFIFPNVIEGLSEGRWILLDYGSLIIHIFYDYVRSYYNLEDLWQKAKEVKLSY